MNISGRSFHRILAMGGMNQVSYEPLTGSSFQAVQLAIYAQTLVANFSFI